jgi:hypothetical protein
MRALVERRIEMSIEGDKIRIDDLQDEIAKLKPRSTPSPWRSMKRVHGAGLASEVRDEASWQKSR